MKCMFCWRELDIVSKKCECGIRYSEEVFNILIAKSMIHLTAEEVAKQKITKEQFEIWELLRLKQYEKNKFGKMALLHDFENQKTSINGDFKVKVYSGGLCIPK